MLKIAGQKFNSLTAIAPVRVGGKLMWAFRCDCGKSITRIAYRVKSGHIKTCGCNIANNWGWHLKKHGLAKKMPEYGIWKSMRQRCRDKNCKSYKNYGGKGISVCVRWSDFANFLEDMGQRPSAKHTLDRIDVTLGYGPGNCRWATWKEQQRNRSNNRMIAFNGRSLTSGEWEEVLGFPKSLINTRLHRGWSIEDALSTAPRRLTASARK